MKGTMKVRKQCRATGKLPYATRAAAAKALAFCVSERRRHGKVYRMERSIYLCDHCDCWHLSSRHRRTAR